MGDSKLYQEVISRSLRRTMKRFGLDYRDEEGRQAYASITTFEPYPDVPETWMGYIRITDIAQLPEVLGAGVPA
jgi:hypothetical protein